MPENHILFLNIIASPSGVADFAERFPNLRVVTAFIDQGLDEKKYVIPLLLRKQIINKRERTMQYTSEILMILYRYIIPGLGDFGDRYYTL